MDFMTTKEASDLWNVSERMVRLYCTEGRIPGAEPNDNGWLVPVGTPKPLRKVVEKRSPPKPNLTAFAKRVVYQRGKNNHFGIYEYIQINLTYSSNRMASNRLTRNEVEEVYRTNKISSSFEPVKVDDIIETINHFSAVRYIVDTIETPITRTYVKRLHQILTYGTYADRKEKIHSGEFRTESDKLGIPAKDIDFALLRLMDDYEKKPVNFERVVEFHAKFERIHPFEDYNGRVGRLIMMKECLRYGIDPFIIDDKHRSAYNRGITNWDVDRNQMINVALEAQKRFQGKMVLCDLFIYARYPGVE